jgi:TIR domain
LHGGHDRAIVRTHMRERAMTDVFISYKKEDAARVEPIARGLARAGYEVWWDHHIPPGRSYREVIGAQLQSAKCVIVVWSKLSVEGQWVLDEADAGKQRNVLLPMFIDDVEIPYGFRQIEAARLTGWTGDANDHEWASVLSSVAHFVGRPPGGPPKPFVTPTARPAAPASVAAAVPKEKSGGGIGPVLVGAVLVALLAGGGYFAWQTGVFDGAQVIEDAGLSAPDAAVPLDQGAPTATPAVGEIETHDYVEPSATASAAPPPQTTTQGLRRATFQSGGAIVRDASGAWIEENAQTGALDGARWREESRDADTITLRDDGRRAGMRIELSENAIYLYFPDWGEWRKQWIIGEKNYE